MSATHLHPFIYLAAITLISQVATGLGFAISATFNSLVVASAVTPLILLPLAVAGGLFANTETLHPYWYWLQVPSYCRKGFILVARNEFSHLHHITCDFESKGDLYCLNQPKNGNQVLEQLGFETKMEESVYLWVGLVLLFFLFRAISVISLSVAAREKT